MALEGFHSESSQDNIQLFTVKDCVLALLILDAAVLLRSSRTSGGKPEFRAEWNYAFLLRYRVLPKKAFSI